MSSNDNKGDFILASGSPRRRHLLDRVGFSFRIIPSEIREINSSGLEPQRQAIYWAVAKAREVAQRYPREWVLGADTIVVLDDIILGKPAGPAEAKAMLSRLSGRSHLVITGLCLVLAEAGVDESECVETTVRMREINDEEIQGYVNTGEPLDKAGAYGIQGIGGCLIERIEGSYSNVVGLPLSETVGLLRRHGVADPFGR